LIVTIRTLLSLESRTESVFDIFCGAIENG
jgi:hypothetical protein